MRAFVALDLPGPLIGALTRLQAGLTVGRPVPEENLHLTLAFLGDIREEQAWALAEGLEALSAAPVPLTLRGVDLPGRSPNLIWIGAEPAPELIRLHDKVARLAREAGVALERRRFSPHVTLARFPRALSAQEERGIGAFLALNGAASCPPGQADTVTLYRSHLHEDGPVYEPLAEARLTG